MSAETITKAAAARVKEAALRTAFFPGGLLNPGTPEAIHTTMFLNQCGT